MHREEVFLVYSWFVEIFGSNGLQLYPTPLGLSESLRSNTAAESSQEKDNFDVGPLSAHPRKWQN